MKTNLSNRTKDALAKLVNIQRQIIGEAEIVRYKLIDAEDMMGIGLDWACYVSKIQTDTGFTIVSAVDADADFSLVVAFGNGESDLTPFRYCDGHGDPLSESAGCPEPFSELVNTLALRFAQIGIENRGDRPERLDPFKASCPFGLLWTQVLFRHDLGNGVTAIAGIDPSAHHVLIYFQGEERIMLDPRLVEFPTRKQPPSRRLESFIYGADAMWHENWPSKEKAPALIDAMGF